MKRWNENAHIAYEKNLLNRQHELTELLNQQNDKLDHFHLDDHGQ